MLAFKVAFFVLVAAPFISSAPSATSPEINCYIDYLKSKNLFTEAYSPSPLVVNPIDCDKLVNEFRSISEKTYSDLFARNKETEGEFDCIMAKFRESKVLDSLMLTVVYEAKKVEGVIDKDSYCKLSSESKKKTKDLIIQSVESCVQNSKFVKTFAFQTECAEPKVESKIATV